MPSARSSACTSRADGSSMHRARSIIVTMVVMAAVATSCSSDGAPVDPTAPLGLSNTIDTLFPPSRETIPIEDGTAPAGALFAGDMCTALTATDIDGVTFPTGPATLREFGLLAVDRCQYLVDAGANSYYVEVQAVGPADFAALVDGVGTSGTTGGEAVIEAIDDLGLVAFGLETGVGYQVSVQADQGYFQLSAPDRAAALLLATRALTHAG